MTVVRDFERLYREQDDPWGIGAADSDRYRRYLELIAPHANGTVLDIGCGFGAMLSQLAQTAASLDGVEISATAIEKGRQRFPFVTFHQGSASTLDQVTALQNRKFSLIVASDVIYYLADRDKEAMLGWINSHLEPDGVAFIAAWCPGGKYLTSRELLDVTSGRLIVSRQEALPQSGHLALLCRKRRRLAAITIDYETWHPIPEGKEINWDRDVFEPTERLFSLFEKTGVAATFFAEMGEYFWLLENEPALAARMEEQWREAVGRGHDVQLHLHPCWLPETGAKFEDGKWWWDWSKGKAANYPGDLSKLIGRCKQSLENLLRPVKPDYSVTSFRAGGYQAQPFELLSKALIDNGILCDSSVHPHGTNSERGYEYLTPFTTHQPYFADLLDPQMKAVPAEEAIVELPIFTPEFGQRWFIDGAEGKRLAERLISYERRRVPAFSSRYRRMLNTLRHYSSMAYSLTARHRGLINRLLPRKLAYALVAYENPRPFGNLYYVAIGHTKADLHFDALESNLNSLRETLDLEYVTISDMASVAKSEIEDTRRRTADDEMAYQVSREREAILGESRNEAQSFYLQEMIPLDKQRVLDFGCGAGYWSARIAELYPWMNVTGLDAGVDFIAKARKLYESPRVNFEVGDFARLSHPDGAFDCVYADNTLEHGFDVDATLREIYRVLAQGGVLVAAIPVDGLNPGEECDNHTWRTVAAQIRLRLERAGFSNIFMEEVDTYRKLGMPPYMPSLDRMVYLRAWKAEGGDDRLKRALRAMDWLYRRIDPNKNNQSQDGKQIIADGFGYCLAYTVSLGQLLKREGYDIIWVTMWAAGHERGEGPDSLDSHEVIEMRLDGECYLLDPMANSSFPYSTEQLLKTPALADRTANRDERCQARGYHLYNTAYWYERVTKFSRRRNIRFPWLYWKKNRK